MDGKYTKFLPDLCKQKSLSQMNKSITSVIKKHRAGALNQSQSLRHFIDLESVNEGVSLRKDPIIPPKIYTINLSPCKRSPKGLPLPFFFFYQGDSAWGKMK